jgi:hypothetical protein
MYWYHAARVNATGTEIPACRVSPSGAAISSPSFRASARVYLLIISSSVQNGRGVEVVIPDHPGDVVSHS